MTDTNTLAQWMIGRGYATGHGDSVEDLLRELEWQIAERERETCAKVCDGIAASKECQTGDLPEPAEDCAAAIRARGQA